MSDEKGKGRGGCLLAGIVVAVLLLPLAYLLSLGPAYWLMMHAYLPASVWRKYEAPADFVAEHCPPFRDAAVWYLQRFDSADPPAMPVFIETP